MRCVCGRFMHLVDEHLNYNIWYCSRCDRTEIRWKEASGDVVVNENKRVKPELEDIPFYLAEIIEKVLSEETEGNLPLIH